ncbi:MAG: hypothetical protein H7145_06655 [Akkermansiaceae bacterium]|nr:hypothetical protein [Armatimonadota bacterium]
MKKDLILRMIEQLGSAIARIMNLNRSGNHEEAQTHLNQTFRLAVGFDREFIEKATADSLVALLIADKPPSVWLEPACILVRLLHEQAFIHRAVGNHEKATDADLKALSLLFTIQKKAAGRELLAITPGVVELVGGVSLEKLPPFLQKAIEQYKAQHTEK